MKALGLYLFVLGALLARPARCEVQRFAVVVGNNRGEASDTELRYGEADAEKVASVLRDIGGVEPSNLVVLRGETATTVRSTLIAFNDRIRAAAATPNTQTLLFVYYSGHADAGALRLGASRLELGELTRLVRGSAATFRLLVVDACRSGTLTRVKGGKIVAPFALATEPELHGEGMALLTASSANEDAQESDELRGSFFTHGLVSGLLGAADTNRDGAVTLEEAYRHAYDTTLRSTSRTFAGIQHPTFQFDVRGQEWLVLTRPGARENGRAQLSFPKGIGFLVMTEGELGPVVGEVGATDTARKLSLRPGRYFLRGRASDALLEGLIDLDPGEVRSADPAGLKRVTYARLVRKGGRDSGFSHGPQLGLAVRSALPNAAGACAGPVFGYRIAFETLSVGARLGACTSGFDNPSVRACTDEYALGLSIEHDWDLAFLSVSLAVGAAATWTRQSFESRGLAPTRNSVSPLGFAGLGLTRDLSNRLALTLEARPEAHLLRLQADGLSEPRLELHFALRGAALLGFSF